MPPPVLFLNLQNVRLYAPFLLTNISVIFVLVESQVFFDYYLCNNIFKYRTHRKCATDVLIGWKLSRGLETTNLISRSTAPSKAHINTQCYGTNETKFASTEKEIFVKMFTDMGIRSTLDIKQ